MFCEKCGTQIIEGQAFCTNCGTRLVVAPVAEAVPAPTPIVEEKEFKPSVPFLIASYGIAILTSYYLLNYAVFSYSFEDFIYALFSAEIAILLTCMVPFINLLCFITKKKNYLFTVICSAIALALTIILFIIHEYFHIDLLLLTLGALAISIVQFVTTKK